jgi:hypothetical protein
VSEIWGKLPTVVLADAGSDVWNGWGSVILVVGFLGAVLVVIGMVIWQIFKTSQTRIAAKAVIERDEEYRELAAQAISTQQKLAEEQKRIGQELSALRVTIGNMERLLREVE